MAPEILQGNKYDEKIDRYSFGVCLWEIATRRDPYKKRRKKLRINEFELAARIAKNGLRPHIPAAGIKPLKLLTLIKQMWNQDPEKRPSFEHAYKILEEIKSERMHAGNRNEQEANAFPERIPVPRIVPVVPASGPGPVVGAVILSKSGDQRAGIPGVRARRSAATDACAPERTPFFVPHRHLLLDLGESPERSTSDKERFSDAHASVAALLLVCTPGILNVNSKLIFLL